MNPVVPTSTEVKNRRLVAAGAFTGAAVEWYDFLLYALCASVVFPSVFFPEGDKFIGTLVSFASLAVGYLARPIGGLLFGHFGDRFGRKQIVVITIMVMGIVSFLIGLIPSYQEIGVAAPIILISLRLCQGIALGGEFAGASLLAIESGQPTRRGWSGGISISGGPFGAALANLALAGFSLPAGGLLNGLGGWAWRIPFLLSAVLVIFSLFLRLRIQDSPEYRGDGIAVKTAPKFPLGEVLMHFRKQTVVGIIGGLAPFFVQSLIVNWMIAYAIGLGYNTSQTLWTALVANLVNVFGLIGFGLLSDHIGRKKVLVSSMVAIIVLIVPIFLLVQTKTWWGLLIAMLLGAGVLVSSSFGPFPTWLSEKFPSHSRFTGVSLAYQVAGSIAGGLAPLIAASLLHAGGGSFIWIGATVISLATASGLAFLFSREDALVESPMQQADVNSGNVQGEEVPIKA
jgi:MFS family permease